MERKKVLITVTTYPLPSDKYQELVCTAGILENGSWVRIYPIPLSHLVNNRFRKYHWVEIDLKKRNIGKDFRPESFNPVRNNLSDLQIMDKLDTKDNWRERKKYCLQKVYTNLKPLIEEAYNPKLRTSLATYKPTEIINFDIIPDDREWKKKWQDQMKQLCLFTGDDFKRLNIPKVPYKFKYRFKDEDGSHHNMMVEDWEIGQLYWNCLRDAGGNEKIACQKVKEKCWNTLALNRDLYFFLGTTYEGHRRKWNNPFVIIGLFYPTRPKLDPQLKLFS